MSIIKRVSRLLRETADKLDTGNSSLSQEEPMHIMGILCHEEMSKAQACQYLNMSRSNFDMLVRTKQMPKGKKVVGHNELRWYKDELEVCIQKIKKKNPGCL